MKKKSPLKMNATLSASTDLFKSSQHIPAVLRVQQFISHLPDSVKGYFLLSVTLMVWGSFTLLSRVAVKSSLTPWDLSAVRFIAAGVILIPWLIWFYPDKKRLVSYKFIVLAFLGGFGYSSIAYLGFNAAPAAHAAIWLNGMLPLFSALAAWFLCQEAFTHHTYYSLLAIFSGLSVMALLMYKAHAFSMGTGDLFFILAAMCWGTYTALLKRWQLDPVTAMLGVGVGSSLIYLPLYVLFLPKNIMAASWQSIAYQGVFHGWMVVIVAMLSYIGAIKYLGAFKTGSLLALAPLLAALLAVPLLHEPLNAGLLAGLVGVFIGATQPWRWSLK